MKSAGNTCSCKSWLTKSRRQTGKLPARDGVSTVDDRERAKLLFPNSGARWYIFFSRASHVYCRRPRTDDRRTLCAKNGERGPKKEKKKICIVESITVEINKSGTEFTSWLVKSSGKRLL